MSSLSVSVICKILAVFLLFCMTKASGGTCLSYGHSCWGGHGKRNSMHHLDAPAYQKRNSDWFLSRLLNPSIESTKKMGLMHKTRSGQSDDFDKFRQYENQIFPIADLKENNVRDELEDSEADLKSFKLATDGNESEEDIVFLNPEIQRVPLTNYKLFQIMDKEDDKKKFRNLQN